MTEPGRDHGGGASPLVTVVTVALNAGQALDATMTSVLSQTYPLIDYVVIDGGSEDDSTASIEARADRLGAWVSEPDGGIYDAMNKGIALARGDWIIFMNAGDLFASDRVVEEMMQAVADDVDFLYGDVEVMSPKGPVLVPCRPLELMWQRIAFSHQSLFARTELMRASPFDLTYDVIADYAFYFSQYAAGRRFRHTPLTVAKIATDGYSERKIWRRTVERWRVARRHRPSIGTDLFYMKLLMTHVLPIQARRLLKAGRPLGIMVRP